MNSSQRKQLKEICDKLNFPDNWESLDRESRTKRFEIISDAADAIQEILDEEQEKYDNMPESLQSGSRGEALQEVIDALTEAVDHLTNAAATVEDCPDGSEGAPGIEDWAEEIVSMIENGKEVATGV